MIANHARAITPAVGARRSIRERLLERDGRVYVASAPYDDVEAAPCHASRYDASDATIRPTAPVQAIVVNAAFGIALRACRTQRRPRLSQARLSEASGFDHSYVSRLESGTRQPTRDAVMRLATALDTTPAERDRLLSAAGFATAVPFTDALVAELDAMLNDPTLPEMAREVLRGTVEAAMWLVRSRRATGSEAA